MSAKSLDDTRIVVTYKRSGNERSFLTTTPDSVGPVQAEVTLAYKAQGITHCRLEHKGQRFPVHVSPDGRQLYILVKNKYIRLIDAVRFWHHHN